MWRIIVFFKILIVGETVKIGFKIVVIALAALSLLACDGRNIGPNGGGGTEIMANGKVILTVFAGREDRMPILNSYVLQLLNKGLIDEYHIWNLTRKGEDEVWLRNWVREQQSQRKNSSKIILFQPKKKEYRSVYAHYYANRKTHVNDIFIKMDDDIAYIDLEHFKQFVEFRAAKENEKYWLVSANVINNGVCAFYQQKQNPKTFFISPVDNKPKRTLSYPPAGLCGELWESGEMALEMHEWFLSDKGLENTRYLNLQELPLGDRISINTISWLGRDLENMAEVARPGDDEHLLSVELSKQFQRPNIIFGPFVVSHLSFGKQEESAVFRSRMSELLRKYAERAKKDVEKFDGDLGH
jgi:hypothetical protein